jgi:hypothetical protein
MKTKKTKEKPEPIDSGNSIDESIDTPIWDDTNSERNRETLFIPKQKAFKRLNITQSECAFENSDIDNIIDQIEGSLKKTKP